MKRRSKSWIRTALFALSALSLFPFLKKCGSLCQEIWLDTHRTHQSRDIREVIPYATRVTIGRSSDHAHWSRLYAGDYPTYTSIHVVSLYLKIPENPRTMDLLRQSGNFHAHPVGWGENDSDILIDVTTDRNHLQSIYDKHFYVYLPETGEIGWRNMWLYTPPKFQRWMNELIARMPDRNDITSSQSVQISAP